MNKPPNPRRAAIRAELAAERAWRRGESRGQANHWRARNNRKISRIAARV